jgi:hypothetical protein
VGRVVREVQVKIVVSPGRLDVFPFSPDVVWNQRIKKTTINAPPEKTLSARSWFVNICILPPDL